MTAPRPTISDPVRIALGSTNPAKQAATEQAAAQFFARPVIEAIDVPSGVPAQPWGDEETAFGAQRRAEEARLSLDADYGIGIESGVATGPGGGLYVAAWAVAVDRDGGAGFGASERFPLPEVIAGAVRAGGELGPALDALLGVTGLARREGAIGILTEGRRSRTDMLTVATIHAFASLLQVWRGTLAR